MRLDEPGAIAVESADEQAVDFDRRRGMSTSTETGRPIGVEKGPPDAKFTPGGLRDGRCRKGALGSLKNGRGNLGTVFLRPRFAGES